MRVFFLVSRRCCTHLPVAICAQEARKTSKHAVNTFIFYRQTYRTSSFTCASTQVFGVASVIVRGILFDCGRPFYDQCCCHQWGVIGPALQFSKGQGYYALTFLFLIGASCPIILWLVSRKSSNTVLNYLKSVPVPFSKVISG